MAIDPSAEIHPAAVVAEGAVIGAGATVGPFCVVGPEVVLAPGVVLHSHVAVAGVTRVGEGTQIFPFASIGHAPQDLKYAGERVELVIGARKPFGIVLTMVRPGSRTLAQAQELLTKAATAHGGELCPITMGNRVAYTDSVFFAKTVTEFEPNGAAAEEMTGIWTWVGKRAVAAARRAKDG